MRPLAHGWKLAQHRLKIAIKPKLVANRAQVRKIRFGPARGRRMLLNRMTDMQRELGLWETELNGLYRSHIRPHSIVFDIGAADGLTAITFATLAPSGQVVAFEPSEEMATRFSENVALNPALEARIRLVRRAVGSTDGVTIDRFVDDNTHLAPDFVKIDVDGEELTVIRSMAGTLAEHRPIVLLETHSVELEQASAREMAAQGYQTNVVKNARWRALYPEWRPIEHNRWLLCEARPAGSERR